MSDRIESARLTDQNVQATDSLHPGETTDAEKHDPDPTEHPISPPGQATSPASDAQAKDHQRTGEPDADAHNVNPVVFDGEMQRLTVTLPRLLVERIDRFQDTYGLPSRGHAIATLLAHAPDTSDTPDLSNTPPAIAPGLTSSGAHRNY